MGLSSQWNFGLKITMYPFHLNIAQLLSSRFKGRHAMIELSSCPLLPYMWCWYHSPLRLVSYPWVFHHRKSSFAPCLPTSCHTFMTGLHQLLHLYLCVQGIFCKCTMAAALIKQPHNCVLIWEILKFSNSCSNFNVCHKFLQVRWLCDKAGCEMAESWHYAWTTS